MSCLLQYVWYCESCLCLNIIEVLWWVSVKPTKSIFLSLKVSRIWEDFIGSVDSLTPLTLCVEKVKVSPLIISRQVSVSKCKISELIVLVTNFLLVWNCVSCVFKKSVTFELIIVVFWLSVRILFVFDLPVADDIIIVEPAVHPC